MRITRSLACSLLFSAATAFAQLNLTIPVDCSHGASLQAAVALALPGTTIIVKGTCTGPITITTPGLKLDGKGTGAINGSGKDAVTINGAQRTVLAGLTISGGNNGVVAKNNAQVTLQSDTITGNALTGLLVQANAAAAVSGGGSSGNGFNGVDVEATSSLNVTGAYSASNNGVFGVEVNNGSSINLVGGNLTATGNVVGVQLGTNAAGFLDGASSLNASNNFALGLTMTTGSHMADFGGTIVANQNGLQGIALDSKAGLDMDAGAQVQANNNGTDGVHLEEQSVMSIFNTPQFSGVSGTTTLTAQGNQATGINLLTNSSIFDVNFAALQVTGNAGPGIALDDGSSLSFGQSVPVSGVQTNVTGNHPDVEITFASRLTTLGNDTVGTVTCDATALVRGPLGITCPH